MLTVMLDAPPCIYCDETDPQRFQKREHVIPQAFGRFGAKTPTLDCVCDGCNAYFGRELDQALARETLEGISRYRHGIFSKELRRQKRLRFTLADEAEVGEFKGAVVEGIDPTTNKLLRLVTQLHILNIQTEQTEIYTRDQLGTFTLPDEMYGKPGERKLYVFAPSKQEHDDFVAELKQAGFDVRMGAGFPMDLAPPLAEDAEVSFGIHIEGVVDDTHRRALAKILVNFAAYFTQSETEKPEWTVLKRFIRYGEGKLGIRASHKPFWDGQETDDMRFAGDSINLRIERHPRGTVGIIQFYNWPSYELLLIEDYHVTREVACRFTPGQEPIPGYRGARLIPEGAE